MPASPRFKSIILSKINALNATAPALLVLKLYLNALLVSQDLCTIWIALAERNAS